MHILAKRLCGIFILAVVLSTISGFTKTGKFGADVVEIYLNDKLLMRHALYKPVPLQNLDLTNAKENDQLVVRYRECHAPESGVTKRSISLRDEAGNVVKSWNFSDGENYAAMSIPVKEIIAAQKQSKETLVLAYSSGNLGRVQNLAAL